MIIPLIFIFLSCRKKAHDTKEFSHENLNLVVNHESRSVNSNPEHVRNMIITYGHFVKVVVGTGRVLSFELGYIVMPRRH